MDPVGLGELLQKLPHNEDPALLVGFKTSDDAAVYRLSDDEALVLTADIITPPVNDPFLFGQIAAANSISDVYAMGGRPVACLNLVCFPSKKLPPEDLHEIIAGALNKITESGAVLAGGHSVDDDEPKFGLSVTGLVHPDRVWTNAGAQPGDVLILTKPLGTGVLFNANVKGWVSPVAFDTCTSTAAALNRTAAEALQGLDVHAATDITGFGLAGHGLEMARGSNVAITLELDALPTLPEAVAMYERGVSTGVNAHNRAATDAHLVFHTAAPDHLREIVFDPQTSGGILAAIPRDQADDALAKLHDAGVGSATKIGQVRDGAPGEGTAFLEVR